MNQRQRIDVTTISLISIEELIEAWLDDWFLTAWINGTKQVHLISGKEAHYLIKKARLAESYCGA